LIQSGRLLPTIEARSHAVAGDGFDKKKKTDILRGKFLKGKKGS